MEQGVDFSKSRDALPAEAREWRPILHDMKGISHAATVRAFFSKAVLPVCLALAKEVAALESGKDKDEVRRWRHARTTQMTAHQSFALTLGALWEREFQDHLRASAAIIRPQDYSRLEPELMKGSWKGLTRVFQEVRGFPLESFPMFPQLKRLHLVTSAVRHGVGWSARELYKADEGLFLQEALITGWFDYFVESVDPASVSRLDLKMSHLEEFRDAVADFWTLISEISKSSEWKKPCA